MELEEESYNLNSCIQEVLVPMTSKIKMMH